MNTSPASVVGGISTANSAFRISFSRTISHRPVNGLFGKRRRGEFNPRHIASSASFIRGESEISDTGYEDEREEVGLSLFDQWLASMSHGVLPSGIGGMRSRFAIGSPAS